MIDFRYHVVSLVSVFLALAVGIALGAGPLKDPIGNTLTGQVKSLRQEKQGLRDDLTAAEDAVQRRDTFITGVGSALTHEQLGGRSIVVVTLPGADTSGLNSLTSTLKSAGATVTGRVDVKPAWTDPNQRAFREELAGQLSASLAGGAPTSASTDQVLAGLLARAVVTPELLSADRPDAAGQSVLAGLKSGKLIGVSGDLSRRATAAVLLAPPAGTDSVPTPTPTPTDVTTSYLDLVSALDAGSAGAVVLGPASAAGNGGVIAAVRGDDKVSHDVSTVDTGGTPMGDITTVLALREQLVGGTGNYGFAAGAKAPMPTLAVAAGGP
jgi:Copper transport outer membrane protein, MctB